MNTHHSVGKAIFLTGTGTDVGKTTFAAALAHAVKLSGYQPSYYKPVLSGATRVHNQLVGGDLSQVQNTAPLTEPWQSHCSYLFEKAVSPHLAARHQHIQIDSNKLLKDFQDIRSQSTHLIVEGAGGSACPLSDSEPIYTIAHLMAELRCPSYIVCSAELGTLHHTVATLAYLNTLNVPVSGLLVNSYEETPVCKDNLIMLERMTKLPVLAVLPRLDTPITPQHIQIAVRENWQVEQLVRRLFL